MAIAPHDRPFDPLIDLDGLWTPALAERYLPIEEVPPARYEAADGRLVLSPRGGSAHSWAAVRTTLLLRSPVRAAGHALYSALNLQLGPTSWIEPDLVVLSQPVVNLTWIPADLVLMPIEFVSPSSRRRDRIDKPRMAAAAGIPYYLRAEIDRESRSVELHLFHLEGGVYGPIASSVMGQKFHMKRPFEVSFNPTELLEP